MNGAFRNLTDTAVEAAASPGHARGDEPRACTRIDQVLATTRFLLGPALAGNSKWTRLIEQSANSLLHVVNDVVDMARIDAGHFDLDPFPFEVRTFVDRVVAQLRPEARERGIDLAAEFDIPMPCWVVADPKHMRRVLHDLVGYAIESARSGSVRIVVGTRREWDAGLELCFEIEAEGFDAPAIRSTVDSLKLEIARELAHLLGGGIALTKTAQGGLVIRFTAGVQPREPGVPQADSIEPSNFEIFLDDELDGLYDCL